MNNLIACRHCNEPDCRGCNLHILEQALHRGVFDSLKEEGSVVIRSELVPVRHGRWIWDDEGFHCSECWHHAYGNTGEVMSGEYKYCPFCGAVMEQDGDGE